MKDINKTKKIVIYALIASVVLTMIMSIVDHVEDHSFNKWVYDTYVTNTPQGSIKMTMDNPGVAMMIVTIALTIVIWGAFVGLAFKYSKSKSPSVQGRRWPYIVMLIFGAASSIYAIYSQTKPGHGVISMASTIPSAQQETILAKLNGEYSIIRIVNIISLILNAITAALSVVALVILSKTKKERELQMTMGVIQTGIDEAQANAETKDIEENDLP